MTETDPHIEQETERAERPVLLRTFDAHITPGDGRTVDVRIVPYGERVTHNDGLGGVPVGVDYQEEWTLGAFSDQVRGAQAGRARKVWMNVEHEQGIRGIIGNGLMLREESDGFYGSFQFHDDAAGDKALWLVREGALDGVSLEARPLKGGARKVGGVVQRVKAHLLAIALCRFPAFDGARVLALREEVFVDEGVVPEVESFAPDPELLERCRRLGIRIPQRYEAHPETDGHPDTVGTPGDGNRQPNTTSSEGARTA